MDRIPSVQCVYSLHLFLPLLVPPSLPANRWDASGCRALETAEEESSGNVAKQRSGIALCPLPFYFSLSSGDRPSTFGQRGRTTFPNPSIADDKLVSLPRRIQVAFVAPYADVLTAPCAAPGLAVPALAQVFSPLCSHALCRSLSQLPLLSACGCPHARSSCRWRRLPTEPKDEPRPLSLYVRTRRNALPWGGGRCGSGGSAGVSSR
jgi:hypothetical protein